jgi:hypothetical protein
MPNLTEIQKIYAGSNLIYPAFPDVTFWLESLTTVVAAYSFTKLKSTNTVCCRIRESGGNTESDIGFNAEHRFNETSAQTFTGLNDGLIVSIEDQSGNGYAAIQPTAAEQPTVIELGEIVRTNGSQPHLRHDLSNDSLNVNLPNNQVYYCIASTWSGITHGNFYTASSGDTKLPFGVDFFDLLILADNSEINTIIPNISNRILDGPYEGYVLKSQLKLTTSYIFSNITEISDSGALWKGSLLNYINFGQGRQNDWISLKLSNPENILNFDIGGKNLKGCVPQHLSTLTNATNVYSSSNWFSGFFPSFSDFSSSSLDTVDFQNNNFLTGDSPNISNSTIKTFYCFSSIRLNGAVVLPSNCARLQYFYLNTCNFSRFSGNIQNCPELLRFYFYNNQIQDNLPILPNLPKLIYIYGFQNQLTGNIPTLVNCPSLTIFRVEDNQLTGVVSGFSVPTTLNNFVAKNNQLSAAAVNEILVAFDTAGKTSGYIDLSGTGNAAPDSSSGGFDGLAAITNLEAKGNWNITTN